MTRSTKLLASAVALLVVPGIASAATLTIDDFTSTQRAVDIPEQGSGDVSQLEAAAPSAIGGFRDIDAQNDDGREAGTSAGTNNTGQGFFRISNESGTSGDGVLTYDGEDGAAAENQVDVDGLGSVDLTFGGSTTNNRFIFDVIESDFAFDYGLTIWSGAGNTSETVTGQTGQLISSRTPETIFFSAFSTTDFSDVGAIQLGFSGVDSSDLTIDLLRVQGDDISPIPLPAGLPLLVGGLLAFGALRRRARG